MTFPPQLESIPHTDALGGRRKSKNLFQWQLSAVQDEIQMIDVGEFYPQTQDSRNDRELSMPAVETGIPPRGILFAFSSYSDMRNIFRFNEFAMFVVILIEFLLYMV